MNIPEQVPVISIEFPSRRGWIMKVDTTEISRREGLFMAPKCANIWEPIERRHAVKGLPVRKRNVVW